MRLMNLPGYSPDFNADEAIWGWAREEATGNPWGPSLGAAEGRQLPGRTGQRRDEVRRRSTGPAVKGQDARTKLHRLYPINS